MRHFEAQCIVVDIYLALQLTHGLTVYGRVREPHKSEVILCEVSFVACVVICFCCYFLL